MWVERTRIPIEIARGTGSVRSNSSMSESEGSRSTQSRLAGYASESEHESCEEGGAGAAAAAATPTAVEPAAAAPEESEGAAEESEETTLVAAAAVAAAAALPELPALAAEEGAREEEEAVEEAAETAAAAAAANGPAAAGEREAAEPAALLSDDELAALKLEADRLLQSGNQDEAEAAYARYLRQCPADVRVWSNRAENHCRVSVHGAWLRVGIVQSRCSVGSDPAGGLRFIPTPLCLIL